MPKVRVSLYLTGDSIPLNELTKKLGTLPSKTRTKQEWPQPSILAGIAKDAWEFRTDKEETKAISTQFTKLKQIFNERTEIISQLIDEYFMSCNIVILIEAAYNDYPEMVLSADDVAFLASIKAEVGFDLYIDDLEENTFQRKL